MFKSIAIGASLLVVFGVAAYAADNPLQTALNIQKTKNPLGTLIRNNHACNLISPPTALLFNDTQAGAATPANILIAKLSADGTTYDLGSLGNICPTPDVTSTFPIRVKDFSNGSITTSIAYKDDITASIKLTLGSWLKLIDFSAANIEEVGIWITTSESPAFNPDLNRSAAALKKPEQACTAATKTPQQASIIDRACVGKITISLVAKKDMSLNAFDLTFANLTVGLNASWIRDVNGAASDCTVDASGISTGTPPAGTPPGSATANKVPASNGSLVDINVGNIDAQFKVSSPNVVTKPTAAQIATVSTPTPSPSPSVKPSGSPSPKPSASPSPAPSASPSPTASGSPAPGKAGQPTAQDKVCASNVIYQTNGMLVVGVDMIKAAPYLNN